MVPRPLPCPADTSPEEERALCSPGIAGHCWLISVFPRNSQRLVSENEISIFSLVELMPSLRQVFLLS